MEHNEQYTAAEAAFVLQEPVRTVKKALDNGPVRPVLLRKSGTQVRAIGWADLFYLFAVRSLRDELTPKARIEFYEAIHREPLKRNRKVEFGRYRVSVADLIDQVESRTLGLAQLAEKVEFRRDGEAVLKNTNIEVHRIAALLHGGMTADEILADYPSLTRSGIDTAKAYAEAHPKAGRPYPRMTAKRALRGAGLEALEEAPGDAKADE
jgi:uncharacterized protein (DUF433 family)